MTGASMGGGHAHGQAGEGTGTTTFRRSIRPHPSQPASQMCKEPSRDLPTSFYRTSNSSLSLLLGLAWPTASESHNDRVLLSSPIQATIHGALGHGVRHTEPESFLPPRNRCRKQKKNPENDEYRTSHRAFRNSVPPSPMIVLNRDDLCAR